MLIDITDRREVLVCSILPGQDINRLLAEMIADECVEAASFFEPDGLVLDFTRLGHVNIQAVGVAIHALTIGRRRGFRVAVTGPKKVEVVLASYKLTRYMTGVFETVEEAV